MQRYASEGHAVFPLYGIATDGKCSCGDALCSSPGKHPRTISGHQEATAHMPTIMGWLSTIDGPINIGMPVPAGILIIDLDPRNGGSETWLGLESDHGAFPDTLMQATGSDPQGCHAWYAVNAETKYPGKLGPGVDTRQLGNYVVVAPSKHVSGREYQWFPGQTPVARAPDWILAQGWSATESKAVDIEVGDQTWTDAQVRDAANAIEPHWTLGQRHTLAKSLGGWLQQRGASSGDVAAVFDLLPSNDPDARLAAALTCHAAGIDGRPNGWGELVGVLGQSAADSLAGSVEFVPDPEITPEIREAFRQALMTPDQKVLEQTAALPDSSQADPFGALCKAVPASDILKPRPQIIDGLDLYVGKATALIGLPGAAKSPIALQMALCVANGINFHGRAVKKLPVEYLAWEKPGATNEKRVRIANDLGVDPESARILDMDQALSEPGQVDRVIEAARLAEVKPLVVVDTYAAAVLGTNHNDSEYATLLRKLASGLTEHGCSLLVLMHTRKGDEYPTLQSIEGHTTLGGVLDAALALHHPDTLDKSTIRLSCVRSAYSGFVEFDLKFTDTYKPIASEYPDMYENDTEEEVVESEQLADLIARMQSLSQNYEHMSWGLHIEVVPAEDVIAKDYNALTPREQLMAEAEQRVLSHLGSKGKEDAASVEHASQVKPSLFASVTKRLITHGKIEAYSMGPVVHYRLPAAQVVAYM